MTDNPILRGGSTKIDFAAARRAYQRGENVTQYLQQQLGLDRNTPEVIEVAYELQSGSYVDWVRGNREFIDTYTDEMAQIVDRHLVDGQTIGDVGTGELTTFSYLAKKLSSRIERMVACDVSWSRLKIGSSFAAETLAPPLFERLKIFSAEMSELPLLDHSVDVLITCHALEPNGGDEIRLLRELFRVARHKLILFEPNYERNTAEGRARMERLGYVRNLESHARDLGGAVEEVIPLKTVSNPLNPTFAYAISLQKELERRCLEPIFANPGTNDPLISYPSCYFSPTSGVAYPIIEGIPVLRRNAAVFASALISKTR